MTLPFESKIAINNARLFLTKLLIPKQTKRVPLAVRREASVLLKHYPYPYLVDIIFSHYFNSDDIGACPRDWLKRYENVADEYLSLYNELWNKPVEKRVTKPNKRRKK